MQGINKELATDFLKRNKEMFDMYKQGLTMENIGDKYNISKQRVHQIIRRCKIGEGHYYDALQLEQEKKDLPNEEYKNWLETKGIKKVKNRFL